MIGRLTLRASAIAALAFGSAMGPAVASAQQRPAAQRPAASRPAQPTAIRGFGDVGVTLFSAGDTFDAVLGSSSGLFFGGGVEVVLPQRYFFNVRVSRFQKSGERVFVDEGDVFPLGIDTEVRITPIEITGGYRFASAGNDGHVTPYIGGGVGFHRYSETSDFAEAGEDVSKTFTGFHVLGGVEFRLSRLFSIGGEGQWTSVPDALGSELSSASEAFGEKNLGGLGLRVRFVIGR